MAHIIDLQKLWKDRAELSVRQLSAAKTLAIEPQQRLVSVVIVAKNEQALLQLLASLVEQMFILEVVIVCQKEALHIEDASLEAYTKKFARCYKVAAPALPGLAQAFNFGAQYTSGQFLLFLEATQVLTSNAVVKLLATGIQKPLPWVIGVKSPQPTLTQKLLSKITGYYESTTRKGTALPEVSLVGGGRHVSEVAKECLFLPTRVFTELRALDQKCFDTHFNLDLCLRIHLLGGGVYQVEELVVPLKSASKSKLSDTLIVEWHSFKGWCHFYKKHAGEITNCCLKGLFYGFLGLYAFAKGIRQSARCLLTR